MKIQENAARTFVVFFKDPWTFIIGTFIALLLSCVTLGILAPVMWLGMGEMFRKTRNGIKASYDDLFIYMDKAIMLAIMCFIMGVGVALGTVLLVIPGVILAALWIYSAYYMAYKGAGIMESFKMSAFIVNKNSLMNHIFMAVGIWLIMAVGGQIVVGIFAAYPLCAGFMSFMFEEISEEHKAPDNKLLNS